MLLSPEQLKEKYNSLPKDVQDALFSDEVAGKIQSISKENNIKDEKMSELADEVGLVMYGITKPKNFIPNLSSRLGIDITIARKIAEEVNSKIFSKIRDSLKKIHGIVSDAPVASPTPTSMPVVPEEKISPFEAKTKQEIFRAAPEESKQTEGTEIPKPPVSGYAGAKDPYHEAIE